MGSRGTWIIGARIEEFDLKLGFSRKFERPMSDISRSWGFKEIEKFVELRRSEGLKEMLLVLIVKFGCRPETV